MAKIVRYLRQVSGHLEKRCGQEKARAIMARAQKRYEELVRENEDEPKAFFSMTQKSFGPQAGFASKDRYADKGGMRFNMVKCPYNDKCTQYGCPEIVKGFCDADDICYGSMHPRLTWERTKTIGHGHDVCDFKISVLGD